MSSPKTYSITAANLLRQQAFDNSLQANIITSLWNGKIFIVNKAASKLLGYSKQELQTLTRSYIFDANESNFKKMLKERSKAGHSISCVTALTKKGKRIPCEITSAVFLDEKGNKKVITTITDMSRGILTQKNIDTTNKKLVADNINIAIVKQKSIDIKNEKIVADNISIAKAKQKNIDIRQNRIVQKQLTEAREDARDAERSNIGKELHDNVNQLLGASKMYLEMGKRGGQNSDMYFARSSQYTLSAIEEIRKLTKGLITDIIKNLGLCQAIENTAYDTMEVTPLKIYCHLDSFIENSVNDQFKLNAFRMIQEQLNNIIKHAGATRVKIDLSQDKDFLSLSISDNGVGFDTSKSRDGIGVENIKSRANAYKGTVRFVSRPGKGCLLAINFPMNSSLRR